MRLKSAKFGISLWICNISQGNVTKLLPSLCSRTGGECDPNSALKIAFFGCSTRRLDYNEGYGGLEEARCYTLSG